jgi:hypothetical protein
VTAISGKAIPDLVRATAGLDGELRSVLSSVGLVTVSEIAATEIAARCGRGDNVDEVTVGVVITHEDERVDYLFTCPPGAEVRAERSAAGGTAPCRFVFEMTDLVRVLYSVLSSVPAGTCRIERADEWFVSNADPANPFQIFESYRRAVNNIVGALSSAGRELNTLAARFDSDKWGLWHWFTPHYETHFRRLRDEPVRILEIGIGGYDNPDAGGGSLKIWRDYFRRGHVFGLDVFAKHGLDEDRITTIQGSQNDPDFLRALAARHGPFDIVIDDGSHVNEHVLTSFHALFPHVRTGGFYVVEDLWTAYAPGYGGQATAEAGHGTSIGLVKSLVDGLQYEEWTSPEEGAEAADHARGSVGLHVYRNIVFIEKGVNAEGRIPFFAPRTAEPPLR